MAVAARSTSPAPQRQQRRTYCGYCGALLTAATPHARIDTEFCAPSHRAAYHRSRLRLPAKEMAAQAEPRRPFEEARRAEIRSIAARAGARHRSKYA